MTPGKGDLYRFGAVLSGALYNVAASFTSRRYRALVVASAMIPVGAIAIGIALAGTTGFAAIGKLSARSWVAIACSMTFGAAAPFFLWIRALEHTVPSRVALAVTFKPVSAALLGALVLGEPVSWRLGVRLAGIVLSLVVVNRRAFQAAKRRPA